MAADQSGRETPPSFRPMPPGTDYPSAAWGAATALLLLREEAPDA